VVARRDGGVAAGAMNAHVSKSGSANGDRSPSERAVRLRTSASRGINQRRPTPRVTIAIAARPSPSTSTRGRRTTRPPAARVRAAGAASGRRGRSGRLKRIQRRGSRAARSSSRLGGTLARGSRLTCTRPPRAAPVEQRRARRPSIGGGAAAPRAPRPSRPSRPLDRTPRRVLGRRDAAAHRGRGGRKQRGRGAVDRDTPTPCRTARSGTVPPRSPPALRRRPQRGPGQSLREDALRLGAEEALARVRGSTRPRPTRTNSSHAKQPPPAAAPAPTRTAAKSLERGALAALNEPARSVSRK
jgi:hypothetical protein